MDMIQSYRVDGVRAQELKNKSFELSMEAKEHIKEPDLIRFLIDNCLSSIVIKGNLLSIDFRLLENEMNTQEKGFTNDVKNLKKQ